MITVFTDYACPFCYIAYRQCRKIETMKGCVFNEIFKEIHPDLPEQGADARCFFSEQRRTMMNEQLAKLGEPYGIMPAIGERLSSSRKAITVRAWLEAHYPEQVRAYDEAVFDLYQIQHKDLGDERLLEEILEAIGISEMIDGMIYDSKANEKREADRRTADMRFVRMTPSYLIDKKIYKGLMEENALIRLIER